MRSRTAFRPQRFRVATWEEIQEYGHGGVRARGLLPRIAGGAGYALVGSAGAVGAVTGGGPVTPAWGTGETRAAGNLLICWAYSGTTFTTPTGWSLAATTAGAPHIAIFYKVALGADAAPAIGATGFAAFGQVAEFSGNDAVSPLDRAVAGAVGTATPIVATAAGADAAAGELFVYCSVAEYSATATKTLTNTLNNGAGTSPNSSNNSATSTDARHYSFGFGITTGDASADSDSFAFTTTKILDAGLVIASFKLPTAVAAPSGATVVGQAVTRAAVR